MKTLKSLLEKSGAGDWGTDELTQTLRKGTPGQGITSIGAKNKERKESVELDEGAVAVSTVEKEIRKNGGTRVKKSDREITFTYKGSERKIPVDRGFVKSDHYMKIQDMMESIELDEGTLAAEDPNIVDTLLAAVKNKLLKDLEQGNVKDANEVAKLVKMTIEKDYKHKGYSRLKRK